ncbi:MAG: SIS domain-containing protein, partial [Candidatus Levybacteria bacterium]|nr:SIS domain-containing protein [Candidatus Levybacteria bacterium]
MVKLIEGTYKHAHAMPSGDLKHYAITLMEKGVPVVVAVSNDEAKFDVLNAVNEVRARGAEVIGISPERYEGFDYHLKVPDCGEVSAIMNVVPLQLLAYYMTVELGNNIDRPRNIAKSVTVK